MLESTKNGLTVFVAPTKLVGDVAVSLCFPTVVNSCALSKIGGCGQPCGSNCYPEGTEEACLCYAVYLAVNQLLCGNPLAVSKSKVGATCCGSHNSMFFINWKTKGTVSAVRKSIGIALRALHPAKFFSIYSRLIRDAGGVPKRESFSYVAEKAAAGIKSSLVVGVVGNIRIDQEKFKAMMEVLDKKHLHTPVEGKKSKPSDHVECDHSNHTELRTVGWASMVVSDYLKFRIRGLVPLLSDKFILLPIKESLWKNVSKKLKKGVKEYVQAKYTKLGSDLPEVSGYMAAASGLLCASDIRTMINSRMSEAAVAAAIDKAL